MMAVVVSVGMSAVDLHMLLLAPRAIDTVDDRRTLGIDCSIATLVLLLALAAALGTIAAQLSGPPIVFLALLSAVGTGGEVARFLFDTI